MDKMGPTDMETTLNDKEIELSTFSRSSLSSNEPNVL
ncbi:Uncharacterized protein BM_BM17647 [Brugia malayi]|uniref:Uncharacterized protein n=1 Tax=Brugia malayi TaxID=6279 RepID=A0A4E9FM09_BRUMA|nr:Uncharacterized protein BM_BM17647 [Brugia malayi]VIO96558.1 Uncharacterized protein BM_BM17647 [Brugia malayi]